MSTREAAPQHHHAGRKPRVAKRRLPHARFWFETGAKATARWPRVSGAADLAGSAPSPASATRSSSWQTSPPPQLPLSPVQFRRLPPRPVQFRPARSRPFQFRRLQFHRFQFRRLRHFARLAPAAGPAMMARARGCWGACSSARAKILTSCVLSASRASVRSVLNRATNT